MSTTTNVFPTLSPYTTQPQTTAFTTQPLTNTTVTTQPQTTTMIYTTQPQSDTTMYTTQPQTMYTPPNPTMYIQPTIVPNPTQYPYPYQPQPQIPMGYYPPYPTQLTAPYGTAPIVLTPGSNLPPVSIYGNDTKYINGKKCNRVIKLKPY